MSNQVVLCLYISLFCINSIQSKHVDFQEIEIQVAAWSDALGKDLWDISSKYARRIDAENSFKEATLIKKNGTAIFEEAATKLRDLMESRARSIKSIAQSAEILSVNMNAQGDHASSNYNYFNADQINISRYDSNYLDYEQTDKQYKCLLNDFNQFSRKSQQNRKNTRCHLTSSARHSQHYNFLPLKYSEHFGRLVNTNYTIVKLSPTVYWRERDVVNEVRWTEGLVIPFKMNYEQDPTLTFQYFASPKGFMRMYPATKWSNDEYDRIYDFRKRAWYTEALTNPKDVVILLDKSGSMTGTRKSLSKYIVNNILDTLSNNDFVNIYVFDNDTKPLVNCLGDNLVQANEANLQLLRDALQSYKTEYRADLGRSMEKAFNVLQRYRNRPSTINKCSQAIMIITEGLDYTYKPDVFEKYNRPHTVRVFTFQVGSQDGDQETLKRIACNNMGYYVNISDPGEAHEKVFKYLSVMSRPLNSATSKRTVWSGLYADLVDRRLSHWIWKKHQGEKQRDHIIKHNADVKNKVNDFEETQRYDKINMNRKYNYMVTVSMPVLDFRPNQPELLGVSAVDVPRELLKSLIPHYKIGVNGYAFMVTNNGHIVFHPDHKVEFEHILRPNFNKIDLLELEQMGDQKMPRHFDRSMITLRYNIIKQTQGSDDMNVRIPLDDMKRVILGRRYYYYGPVGQYSLVIVLPDKLKSFGIQHAGEESLFKQAIKIFRFGNWTLHPDWELCNLDRMDNSNGIYRSRQGKIENHCDERFLKLFLADFKATDWFDGNIMRLPDMHRSTKTFPLIRTFLATHSGLTRWQDIDRDVPDTSPNHFGKIHNRAIDETWYRRAAGINYERDAFVYSIPLNNSVDEENIVVTATNVIYVKNQYYRAPAAAIGYQFYHKHLLRKFNAITDFLHKPGEFSKCGIDILCYLLDDNAYVIINGDGKKVGQFFGDLRPDILNMMVRDGVYKRVPFFDYQAVCLDDVDTDGGSVRPTSVFNNIAVIFKWALMTLMTLFQNVWGAAYTRHENAFHDNIDYKQFILKKKLPVSCDQERFLYAFDENYKFKVHNYKHSKKWHYVAKLIPKTNLIFVTVNGLLPHNKTEDIYTPSPKTIEYRDGLGCYAATRNNFTRRVDLPCNDYRIHDSHNLDKKYCGG